MGTNSDVFVDFNNDAAIADVLNAIFRSATATDLFNQIQFYGVTIVPGLDGTYYDPNTNTIHLRPVLLNLGATTAAAILAQEMAHAIEHAENTDSEPSNYLDFQAYLYASLCTDSPGQCIFRYRCRG